MANRWRLLDLGPLPAWRQMALDAVVIRHRAQGKTPNTLRFMQFQPHAALVGYHQALSREIHQDVAHRLGIELGRRITGGGAIYMDARQLGWEICLGQEVDALSVDPDAVYRTLSEIVVQALKRWDIPAQFRPVNDVEVKGRKISGTGGVQWDSAFIYQGTLLVDFDVATMLQVLKLPIEKLTDKVIRSFQERVVTMAELLGQAPPMMEVKAAIIEALERVLDVELVPGVLTEEEEQDWLTSQESYRQPDWIDRRRPPHPDYRLVEVAYKAPGGLMRAALQLDESRQRIQRAFITGDFFVEPHRAVLDLEAELKDAPMQVGALQQRIHRHYAAGPKYLGVTEEHWMNLLRKALMTDPARDSSGHTGGLIAHGDA